MKKLYLILFAVAFVCLVVTLVLLKIMPTGSYVPFIPWGVFIIYISIIQPKIKK